MEIVFVFGLFAFIAFCVAGLVRQKTQPKGNSKNMPLHAIGTSQQITNINGLPMIGGLGGRDAMGNPFGSSGHH